VIVVGCCADAGGTSATTAPAASAAPPFRKVLREFLLRVMA
jgi:hypothetical protein